MKFTGLGQTISVDNAAGTPVAIGADVNTLTLNTTRGEQDVTGLDKSAMERLSLLEDSEITIGGGGFPPAATRAVFENLDNERTVAIGYPDSATFTLEVRLFTYTVNRAADGGLTWTATARLSNGSKGVWS